MEWDKVKTKKNSSSESCESLDHVGILLSRGILANPGILPKKATLLNF